GSIIIKSLHDPIQLFLGNIVPNLVIIKSKFTTHQIIDSVFKVVTVNKDHYLFHGLVFPPTNKKRRQLRMLTSSNLCVTELRTLNDFYSSKYNFECYTITLSSIEVRTSNVILL